MGSVRLDTRHSSHFTGSELGTRFQNGRYQEKDAEFEDRN